MENSRPSLEIPQDPDLVLLERMGHTTRDLGDVPQREAEARKLIESVMSIRDVTSATHQQPLRFRGDLLISAEEAFKRIRPGFEVLGYTPKIRQEEEVTAIYALNVVFQKPNGGIPTGPLALLIITIISVFFVKAKSDLYIPFWTALAIQLGSPIPADLDPTLIPTVDQFRQVLMNGLWFMLSLMGILGAHEMGHFIVARRYKVNTTWPHFIPMPFSILGTMGAVIAMREPAPNRKIQFDIGVAGPLAGLVIAIPVLILGITLSDVGTLAQFTSDVPESAHSNQVIIHEGNSLTYLGLKYLIKGQVLPKDGVDLWIHPVAFAGWVGLLVTALNLIPIGQLDGGHVLFGLFGKKAEKARRPIIGILLAMAVVGTFQVFVASIGPDEIELIGTETYHLLLRLASLPIPGWQGWWIWVGLLYFLVRGHAPILDDITELDPKRRLLGFALLLIFILIFTPRPLVITPFDPGGFPQALISRLLM